MKAYKKEYPRPQMVRENWTSLNGEWDFSFDRDNSGEKQGFSRGFSPAYKINVPYSYETELSGVNIQEACEAVWYQREIEIESLEQDVLIHFEGSDYVTDLWVNGAHAGSHQGAYSRFSFSISNLLKVGKNTLVVKAWDSPSRNQPRGKQRWLPENFACWYVQTTGIWKSVWLESVPKTRIESIKLTPSLETRSVEVIANLNRRTTGMQICAKAYFDGLPVGSTVVPVKEAAARLCVDIESTESTFWGLRTWSPETPDLYDIEITLLEDEAEVDRVDSYFGMREVSISGNKVLLNGKPIYQRLILDQGYWRKSHLTPPSEEAIVEDIDKIMALGYNGVRKHMKIEDERFLYWADVKGLLVWSESAATYDFNDVAISNFTKEWVDIVRQNYNHPSIITWTPFNESWGIADVLTNEQQQAFTQSIYYLTKSMDSMRPVVCNDGWEHTISDIITLHDYEADGKVFFQRYSNRENILGSVIPHNQDKYAFAHGYEYQGQPVIISEFGGIAFNNDDSGWGYGNKVQTEEEFLARFDSITNAIKELDYCCGYCYTQVSDVQQEINGLMDEDRNFKVDVEAIRNSNLK